MKIPRKRCSIVTKSILITLFICFAIFCLNIGVFLLCSAYSYQYRKDVIHTYELESLSNGLVKEKGQYCLGPEQVKLLNEKNAWMLLIDDKGDVIWDRKRPEDVPEHFTIQQIASMSRFYFKDYPIYIWQHKDGSIIVGAPKNSVWRYNVDASVKQINIFLKFFGIWIIANMIFMSVVSLGIGAVLQRRENKRSKRDSARASWISGISHDVRTPLSMILGYAGHLAEEDNLNEEQKQEAEIIKAQAIRLRDLVSNLNLAMKLDYEMQPFEWKKIYLSRFIRETVTELLNDSILEEYEIEVDISDQMEGYTMSGDEFLLKRCLVNLLLNAVKHNPEGCHIFVGLKGEERGCQIYVQDDGKGTEPSTMKNTQGLGLKIARSVIKAHGGCLKIITEKGKGFGVILELPEKSKKLRG